MVDPMCGSATFLIEAALAATRRAPGLTRAVWPFERWHDFDGAAWARAREAAAAQRRAPPAGMRLLGNDLHAGAVAMARRCGAAGPW